MHHQDVAKTFRIAVLSLESITFTPLSISQSHTLAHQTVLVRDPDKPDVVLKFELLKLADGVMHQSMHLLMIEANLATLIIAETSRSPENIRKAGQLLPLLSSFM